MMEAPRASSELVNNKAVWLSRGQTTGRDDEVGQEPELSAGEILDIREHNYSPP